MTKFLLRHFKHLSRFSTSVNIPPTYPQTESIATIRTPRIRKEPQIIKTLISEYPTGIYDIYKRRFKAFNPQENYFTQSTIKSINPNDFAQIAKEYPISGRHNMCIEVPTSDDPYKYTLIATYNVVAHAVSITHYEVNDTNTGLKRVDSEQVYDIEKLQEKITQEYQKVVKLHALITEQRLLSEIEAI